MVRKPKNLNKSWADTKNCVGAYGAVEGCEGGHVSFEGYVHTPKQLRLVAKKLEEFAKWIEAIKKESKRASG